MNKRFIFAMIIFLLPQILALCSEEQININSASKEELDKITWVGPATADKIIAGRPFENLDSLNDVSGIGEKKLADIKSQGLACVDDEEFFEKENSQSEKAGGKNKSIEVFEEINEIVKNETPKIIELEKINLNAQTIKTEDDTENLSKSKYAVYGFAGFCILLVLLFVKKKFNKNEIE